MIRPGTPSSIVPAALVLLAPALLVPTAAADSIKKVDGQVIEDIRIENETLREVTYKKGSRDESVPSDEVLEVTFDKSPEWVEQGLSALIDQDYFGAEEYFEAFVGAHLDGEDVAGRYDWAPGFAAWMIVDIRMSVGDYAGAATAADRVAKSFPDSRYVPMAYMAKADALTWSGNPTDAKKSLEEFRGVIDTKGLSTRWSLECNLGLVLTDTSLSGDARRDRLAGIQAQAGSAFPTVKSRAQVATGQSYIDEIADERDAQKKLAAVGQARPIFESILETFQADDATLAGAYVGLGDCSFVEGTANPASKDPAKLRAARLQYLRVPVLYDTQASFVPKALYMSGLCSWELAEITADDAEKDRARTLFGRLITRYPGSPFADDAKRFR